MYKQKKTLTPKTAEKTTQMPKHKKTLTSLNDTLNTSTHSKTSIFSKPKTPLIKSPIIPKPGNKKTTALCLVPVKLAKLQQKLSSDKCKYLVDRLGHSLIYFKCKGRTIHIPKLMTEVAVGHKTRQQVQDYVRKSFLWSMKQGQKILLYLGEGNYQLNQLFKGANFWEPVKLFQPSSKIDKQWFKFSLGSKDDNFSQELSPGQYTVVIGLSSSTLLSSVVKQLQLDESVFTGIEIV